MKSYRRGLSLLLCLLMLLSLFPAAYAEDGIKLAGDDAIIVPETSDNSAEDNDTQEELEQMIAESFSDTDRFEATLVASGTCGDNVTWTLDDAGKLTVSGTGKMEFERGYFGPWWHHRSRIQSVMIEDGVISIAGSAFYGCSSLTSVTIPDSVASIGDSAFSGCSSLTSAGPINSGCNIKFGWTTEIPDFAFSGCTSLTSVTIPDSVNSIGDFAFFGCSGLTSVTIPEGVTSISASAFERCSSLTSVTIPSSVTSIGNGPFSACGSLTEILVNPANSSYCDRDGVLFSKNMTTIVQFPAGREGTYEIPEGVTSIGGSAFDGCTGLTKVTIPDSVTSIGEYAFSGCTSLTSVHINSLAAWCDISFGNYGSNPLYYAHNLYLNDLLVENLVIPEGKLTVKDYAFDGCSSLTSVTIPDGVTSIGNSAFDGCSSLTSVTIPEGVNSIGDYAFHRCVGLESIEIPPTVKTIGEYAFYECYSLDQVRIRDVGAWCEIEFGDSPFYWTVNPKGASLYVNDEYIDHLVIPGSVNRINAQAFMGCESILSVTIEEGVESIGDKAFERCRNLKHVEIPASLKSFENSSDYHNFGWLRFCPLTSAGPVGSHSSIEFAWEDEIPAHAFYSVDGLKSVLIPGTIDSIGDYAFYFCDNLECATIQEGVAIIGDYAFLNGYNLQTIVFPGTLRRIGSSAFRYCNKLSDIYFNGNEQDWNRVSKDDAFLQGKIHYEKTDPIVIEQHFPDPVFQEYIRRFDEDKNGTLTEGERAGVRTIDVSRLGIGTLEGIEYFPQLTELICGNNNLTALDVSVLPNLTSLHCDFNQLTSLDVSQNPQLKYLNCDYNQLETLNFGGTDQLIELSCSGNQLSDLQLTAFSSLKKLYCGWNQITGLDLSQNSALINLFVNNNSLETLDLSGNPDLLCLWCWGNKIETLDVSGCRQLSESVLSGNIEKYRDSITYYILGWWATDLSVDYDTRLIVASGSWGNLTWTLDSSGTLTISGSGPMKDSGDNSTDAWRSYSDSIKQIVIEDGVTSIGSEAFRDCSSLTSVTIPEGITSIGSSAFSGCGSLKDVYFGGTKEAWDAITVGGDNTPLTNATIHYEGSPVATYTITYDANGGSGAPATQSKTPGQNIKLSSTVPSCEGYTFLGWATSASATAAEYQPGDIYSADASLTLYAIWEPMSITVKNSPYTKGSGQTVSITPITDNSFDGYAYTRTGSYSGAVTISASNYTIQSGRLSFKSAWLDNLSAGTYYLWGILDAPVFLGSMQINAAEMSITVSPTSYTKNDPTAEPVAASGTAIPQMARFGIASASGSYTHVLSNNEYTLSGSTVTLTKDYLNSLADGTYYFVGLTSSNEQFVANNTFTIEAVSASGSWGNLTWTLDSSGTLTISGSGPMKDFGDNSTDAWRSYSDSIKQIVIKDGVTSIGNSAFRGCSSLTSVTIPDSVTSIGSEAFSGCTSLTSVTIPDGVTSIGSYAFWGCSSLTSVTIPDSVTSIDNGAFYGCSSLTSVTIPDGVTSIGEWAFSYCSSLTSVTIPASVTSIGGSAFYGCSSLTSAGPINSGCNIEFGWTTEIPDFAFYGCSGLTSVTIPSSVTSIGNGSFSACGSLTEILVNPANSSYCDRDGVLFSKNMTTIVQFPAGREGAYEIPEGVTSIGGSAFLGCSGLTSVTIPEGVTSIEDNAFCVCSSLTSVTIPDSVTSIGVSAFRGCTSLTSVTIPDSVTSIDAWAFRECRSLTSVTIPEGVTSIGEYAFCGCNSLKDVYFGGTKEAWDAITVGSNNTPLTNATIHYNISSPDFILPAALTEIDEEAFAGGAFSYVKLSDQTVSIGSRAFADCPNLRYVYIPEATTSIAGDAFSGVDGLTILGKSGSYAEFFAQKNGYAFDATE